MSPLGAYFINQSHSQGKLTFLNASFLEKKGGCIQATSPFQLYPPRTILRKVSRVSSLILTAKQWLAKKVLHHGNRFAARVRRRYFSKGEKRRPEIRLRFAGYRPNPKYQYNTQLDKPLGIIRRICIIYTTSRVCGSMGPFLKKGD